MRKFVLASIGENIVKEKTSIASNRSRHNLIWLLPLISAPLVSAWAPTQVAAIEAPVEESIRDYGIGSTWTFNRTLNGKTELFTTTLTEKIQYDGRQTDVAAYSDPVPNPGFPCDGEDGDLFDSATGSWIACTKNGEVLAGTAPHNGGFDWPLEVGNKWRSKYRWIDNVLHPEWSGDAWADRAVIAYEEVTVPAGTFMAYKVSTTGTSSNDWSAVLWYAPELQVTVKVLDRRVGSNGYGTATIVLELVSVDLK